VAPTPRLAPGGCHQAAALQGRGWWCVLPPNPWQVLEDPITSLLPLAGGTQDLMSREKDTSNLI